MLRIIVGLVACLALGQEECNTTCSSYCEYYYPSAKCFAICNCPVPPAVLSLKESNDTQPSSAVETCATTCNLKCKTEVSDKKDACVNLCFKQCIASMEVVSPLTNF